MTTPTAGPLAWVQWTHRLLAYSLAAYLIWWVGRARPRVWWVLAIVVFQIAIAAAMVVSGFPGALQAAHAAVGAGGGAAGVVAAARPATTPAAGCGAAP